jgi:hypothetical protein
MKRFALMIVVGVLCGGFALTSHLAQAQPAGSSAPASQPAGNQVTITCNILSNVHTGQREKSLFLLAYDGTPEIKAEFDKIMADYYPDKGLDAQAALKLQEQFMTRLKYNIDLSGPVAGGLYSTAANSIRSVMSATGTVEIRDGQKWITLSNAQPAAKFAFPPKLLAPDVPLVKIEKEPLVLKLSEALSIKCIRVPAGKFVMGEPYYQGPHWQEDPPHLVTLTKDFYMAECPVTQDIYEAVMGNNPSATKDPKLPVHNVDCANMYKFCELLGAKVGHKVRIPTAAEWEYAARVGTSNPTFKEKYAAQNSNADAKYMGPPLSVMSKPANAWGFYDMHSGFWERMGDAAIVQRQDEVDPVHTPPQDKDPATRGNKHSHFGKGMWPYYISEVEFIESSAGPYRFRVVVDADSPAATVPTPASNPGK